MAQPQDPSQPPTSSPGDSALQPPITTVEAYYQQGVKALKNRDFTQAIARFQRLHQNANVPSAYRLKGRMGLIRAYQQLGQMEKARALCQPLLTSPTAQVRQWAEQMVATLTQPTLNSGASVTPDSPTPEKRPHPHGPTAEGQIREQSVDRMDRSGFVPLPEDASPSLFHYQQLNAQASVDNPSPNPGQDAAPVSTLAPLKTNTGARPDDLQPNSGVAARRAVAPTKPLPKPLYQLLIGQGVTAVLLLWAMNAALHLSLRSINSLLRVFRLSGIPAFEQDYSVWVIAGLIGLTLASPWLMDRLLTWGYGQRSLSTRPLQSQYPAVLRLLRQVCRQQGWQLPELRLIPDSVPLCLSYGWLPRNTRMVVSQGLLDTCTEEELTALYSYELAHIANGDLPVVSGVGLWLLLLHSGYWRLGQWGNSLVAKPARVAVGLVANGLYGLFWLLRKLALWLSRLRCSWADRRAVALTQQPESLQHSLLALTANLGNHFQQQQLHPLLASLDILMPLSPQAAISPGSFFPSVDYLTLMAEDCRNPYRRWLRANATHPSLAERLEQLDRQALNLHRPTCFPSLSEAYSVPSFQRSLLLLQKAPVVGLLAGGGIALGLWFVGGVVQRFGWQRLSWFYQDPSLLQGGLLLGLGLGLLVRINTLYPDISPRLPSAPEAGVTPMAGGHPLPVQGQPIRLAGTLSGAPGVANWFGQDLYLETSQGVIRLRAASPLLGWWGIIQSPQHITQWLGRRVKVSGWWRQGGGLLWLDIAEVCPDSQKDCFIDQGPLWATLVSLGLSLAGIWVIFTGG